MTTPMKVSVEKILTAKPVLDDLAGTKLPFKIGYTVSRIVKSLNTVMTEFDKSRITLLEEHGTLDEETHQYTFPGGQDSDEFKAFQKAFDDLIKTEIDVEIWSLSLDDLLASDKVDLEPAAINTIDWLFDK